MAYPTTVDLLRPGDHLCWTFDDERQRLAEMAGYVRTGLRRREKVVYFTDTMRPGDLLAGLRAHDLDAAAAAATGQVRVTTADDSYLAGGVFDAQLMIESWAVEIAEARREGWAGLRVAADMAWALRPGIGAERLTWYEANVNRAFADDYTTVVCQYDRRLFDAQRLREISAAHPGAASAGAAADRQPLLRMRRTVDPPGLRLSGEVDLSNRQALATMLRALADDPPASGAQPVVDVSGLRFADVATATLLVDAARTGPLGLTVTGCSVALARLLRRVAAMSGTAPGPRIVLQEPAP